MFQDRRYIRVMDRPLFLIYKASGMPEPERTLETWRTEAERAGLKGLFLVRVESYTDFIRRSPQNGLRCCSGVPAAGIAGVGTNFRRKWWHIRRIGTHEPGLRKNYVAYYEELARNAVAAPPPSYPRIPGVTPGWDNSARVKENALIFDQSTPEMYEWWLREIVARQRARMSGGADNSDSFESLIFINAWNEWAEGNHLEPCQKWGRKYLEATQRALESTANQPVARAAG